MSHSTVLIVGEDPEKQLKPFDENLELPRYVKYTKQQLIEKERSSIEVYKNTRYAEYLRDKEKYIAECRNEEHVNYIQNDFPKRLKWTDDELYNEAISNFDAESITPDGGVYSTSNPNAKWDWYSLGGRWEGLLLLKDGSRVDQAKKKDIDIDKMRKREEGFLTFAFLKDGKWYEQGEMGWWGIVSNEKDKDKWQEEFDKLIDSVDQDTLLSVYDVHI